MTCSRLYMVTAHDAGQRLDGLLGSRGLYESRSAAAKAIQEGKVLIDGKPAAKKTIVAAGQAVVYEVPEEAVETPLRGEPIPLDVRFEDDDLLVLSKQAGLICHPSEDHSEGTLVNALIFHCGAAGLCDVQGEQDRLGIVHRLDMDTSGLMLAAKSNVAGQLLMDAIADRAVDRHYLALVHGVIAGDTGMVDAPIARHPRDRLRMAVRDCDSAREALTTFKVLERFAAGPKDNGYSLVECKLYTGRTHQIRVHMEYIGHPVVGDPLYRSHSPRGESASLGLHRQFLHSYALAFEHPLSGDELEFCDNLPTDLQDALDMLAPRSVEVTEAGCAVRERLASAPRPAVDGVPSLLQ